jgi:nucleotide-binding universal stress UspA family protein
MPNGKRKGILVGVDGSERSLHTVRYVSAIPGFRRMNVTLLSLYTEVPEAYWDLQKMPQFGKRLGEIHAWETQARGEMEAKLREAERILVDAGVPVEAVTARSRKVRQGIARDLIKEGKAFQTVAAGRRSSGRIKELMLGSVSTKLLEKVDYAPVVLVGKDADADGVLLALDGSPNAMRSVGYLTRMMAGSDARILLFHAIREKDERLVEMTREAVGEVFEEAKTKLAKAGFGERDVTTRIVAGVESRAEAIVNEARSGGHGTIVLGRKGHSRLQQFFMGRVSRKVVTMARGLAVWVVN